MPVNTPGVWRGSLPLLQSSTCVPDGLVGTSLLRIPCKSAMECPAAGDHRESVRIAYRTPPPVPAAPSVFAVLGREGGDDARRGGPSRGNGTPVLVLGRAAHERRRLLGHDRHARPGRPSVPAVHGAVAHRRFLRRFLPLIGPRVVARGRLSLPSEALLPGGTWAKRGECKERQPRK